MIGALWILAATIITGVALFIHHRLTAKNNPDEPVATEPERPDGCCGQHEVCEKESLLVGIDKNIVYYDDEELDAFRGRADNEYSEAEIEQFRDVLYTLKSDDLAGWVRSIQMREITLPAPVYDEMIALMSDYRSHQ
ncbi:MAG: phospholipase [Muribaculaceae bacterium]|nr:phospholipase [Muribaculaceae bacterium]